MTRKALILVGGYGTRLRPLTLTRPKPLVEFCNKPILFHQIDALVDAGVTTIVLAVSYMCETLQDRINTYLNDKNVDIIFSKEDEPLGTGGPIALAKRYLDGPDPFFVLNSDVICVFPFKKLLEYHVEKKAEATIVVTKVDDPRKYGVLVSNNEGKVLKFIEKPQTFISNKINAGIYLLNTSVINRIPMQPVSIEKDTFPELADDGNLYSFELEGFWMDIGQPHDYLSGSRLYLNHLEFSSPKSLGHPSAQTKKGLIDSSVIIGEGCYIGDYVVIGKNVRIGDGVCLQNCVILDDSVIKSHSYINNALIGWKCTVGKWARIQGCTVLGEDVNVKDEILINGAKVLPHKSLTSSLYTAEIIL